MYTPFIKKLYTDDSLLSIHDKISGIKDDFKQLCDSDISIVEMEDALKSMKRGKSPGTDGLSVEFYLHFWDILKQPLHSLFKDCILKKER